MSILKIFILAAAVNWVPSLTPAHWSQRLPEILNPRTYTSPSGQYAVFIDPGDIYGRNGATYELRKNGKTQWRKKLPVTLWEANISDNGLIGGYGYSNGPEGFGTEESDRGSGTFHVVVIDSEGKLLRNDNKTREGSRFLHTLPNPIAKGIIFDGANDQMVVRIADPDVNRGIEKWQVIRLSTGQTVSQFEPANLISNGKNARSIINAQPIIGTPLTLVHWWRYEGGKVGARFTAFTAKGEPVWSMELADDYQIPGDEDAEDELRRFIWKRSAILPSKNNRQFQLLFARKFQKVTYSVQSSDKNDWSIKEIRRDPIDIPIETEPTKKFVIKEKPLESRGVIDLQVVGTKQSSLFEGVLNIELDGRKRIAFIKQIEDSSDEFIVVDEDGKLLHRMPLNVTDNEEARWSGYAWLGKDRYVLTRSGFGREAKAKAWIVDLQNEKLIQLSQFDCPSIDEVAASGSGDFVVLATLRQKYTSETTVHAFDSSGRKKWSLNQGYSKGPESLFSPEDVAILSSGNVAVIDVIQHNVKLFDPDGKYLRTIQLEQSWGREPNYPSGIARDLDGGFVVADFNGTPPFVRMSSDGSVVDNWQPKFKDGRNVDTQNLKMSASGRLWACDRHSILRLDETGVVDKILGPAPSSKHLGKIASVTIDRHSNIFAADSRTGTVSVFDKNGKLRHVCETKPRDVLEELWNPSLTVDDDGKVYLGIEDNIGESKFVYFAVDGDRIGLIDFISDKWQFQPGSELGLALDFTDGYLVNRDGKRVQKISRRANGNWLEDPYSAAFAWDGSFAIATSNNSSVTTYDRNGTPEKTIDLPAEISFPKLAYDGKKLVIGCYDKLFFCSVEVGEFYRLVPSPATGRNIALHPYFTTQGELLVFDGSSKKIHRYAIPN